MEYLDLISVGARKIIQARIDAGLVFKDNGLITRWPTIKKITESYGVKVSHDMIDNHYSVMFEHPNVTIVLPYIQLKVLNECLGVAELLIYDVGFNEIIADYACKNGEQMPETFTEYFLVALQHISKEVIRCLQ